MKVFLIVWLTLISIAVIGMAYFIGGFVATQNVMEILADYHSAQTNEVARLERKFKHSLESADDEWAERYNVVLTKLHTVQSNFDTLDVWTGDKITVNYKNGMVKHFSVHEQTVREIP